MVLERKNGPRANPYFLGERPSRRSGPPGGPPEGMPKKCQKNRPKDGSWSKWPKWAIFTRPGPPPGGPPKKWPKKCQKNPPKDGSFWTLVSPSRWIKTHRRPPVRKRLVAPRSVRVPPAASRCPTPVEPRYSPVDTPRPRYPTPASSSTPLG